MFDTLQEHRDYEATAYRSEHEAAFDLSRREFDNGMGEIRALVAQGLHVVAMSGPAHCRFTDAIVGTSYSVVSSHLSHAIADKRAGMEAARYFGEDACGFDGDIHVFPEPPKAAAPRYVPSYADDDEIPF